MHMKRLMMVLCCVCAVAAAPAAQTPPTEKPDKGKVDTAAAAKKGSVTVTGCVAAGTEPGHYVLNDATKDGDPAGAPMATYSLMGGELKPHVGHKVAVTGTMDAKSSMSAMGKGGMAKDTMPKETMAKPKESDKAMTVNVKSVKMIAATCS
jgi:hypothetical protein